MCQLNAGNFSVPDKNYDLTWQSNTSSWWSVMSDSRLSWPVISESESLSKFEGV